VYIIDLLASVLVPPVFTTRGLVARDVGSVVCISPTRDLRGSQAGTSTKKKHKVLEDGVDVRQWR
jgi:hypothetical protein